MRCFIACHHKAWLRWYPLHYYSATILALEPFVTRQLITLMFFFCLFVLSRPAGITFWRKSFAPETRHVAVDDRHGCQTRLVYQVNVVDFDCLCLCSPLSSALLPILLV